jgi:sugar phosphate isomerase/epimerase
MPRLAAFPKAFIDALCITGTMTIREWIESGASLGIDGLEFYTGFLELREPGATQTARQIAADHGLEIPMYCCSPDFTHPDAAFRQQQVEKQEKWIEQCAELGGKYCRVLSGQRRAEVSREDGLRFAAEGITACLPMAASYDVTLILENHYKDNYWQHPEFAQHMDVFCDLVDRIHSPNFGVNYDPSNTILAGEDPLELLRRVKHRVVTMHASDRYLAEGTIEDLRKEEVGMGYAKRLKHGVIGRGMNDYDAIFSELAGVGFNGWISIEDGEEGMAQLHESVRFLREKIAKYWLGSGVSR